MPAADEPWEGAVHGGTGIEPDGVAFDPVEVLGELPDVVTLVDATGVIGYATPSVRRVLGLTPEQMIGHRACEFLDIDGRHNCTAWLTLAQHGADLPELAHNVIRRDGSVASFETRVRPIRDGSGGLQLLAVSRDVSARAEIEQRTEQQAHLWSEIGDLISEGVLVLDEDGTVVAANRAAADLLHVKLSELRGAPARQFLATPAPGGPGRVLNAGGLRFRTSSDFAVAPRRRGCAAALRGRAASLLPPRRFGLRRHTVLILEETSRPAQFADARGREAGDALSPREIAVLRLLADGRDVRAIADELGISIHTVRAYVKSILRKLDVRTQLQAVIVSARSGLLDLS